MVSVNLPPSHDPTTEPKPKAVMIQPTSLNEKFKLFDKYNDKNGMTIVPALLMSVIKASHQTSVESPLKVLIYFLKSVFIGLMDDSNLV